LEFERVFRRYWRTVPSFEGAVFLLFGWIECLNENRPSAFRNPEFNKKNNLSATAEHSKRIKINLFRAWVKSELPAKQSFRNPGKPEIISKQSFRSDGIQDSGISYRFNIQLFAKFYILEKLSVHVKCVLFNAINHVKCVLFNAIKYFSATQPFDQLYIFS